MAEASVTMRVGVYTAIRSHISRNARANQFHFLRLRSRPSTLRIVGLPKIRGIQASELLPTLQISTTTASVNPTWNTDSKVLKKVSKCLREIVGSITRLTPGWTTSSGRVKGLRQ